MTQALYFLTFDGFHWGLWIPRRIVTFGRPMETPSVGRFQAIRAQPDETARVVRPSTVICRGGNMTTHWNGRRLRFCLSLALWSWTASLTRGLFSRW